jgi:tetratricopeptide (TPR) repeat protein
LSEFQARPSINHLFEAALALHRAGRLDAAERAYTDVLRRDPGHLEALHHLGVAYAQLGRAREALPLIRRVLGVSPQHAGAHLNLANALIRLMRHEQAILHYEKALSLKPGLAAASAGAAAARAAREELSTLAEHAAGAGTSAGLRLGVRAEALREQGLLAEAVRYYEASLCAAPGNALILTNRGNVLRDLGRLEEALASHDAAVEADGALAIAHSNRAIALIELGQPEASLAACDTAISLDGALAQAHFNRGNALKALGRLPDAITAFERAIALKPGYADALANVATCHLLCGDLATGLPLYEHRLSLRRIGAHRRYRQPRWTGQSLHGSTLFIYHELYLGDMIQLCRYALLARQRGARVLLSAQNALHALLSGLGGDIELIGENQTPDAFDFHAPLLSLPLAFGTRPQTIAATLPERGSYLDADPARAALWRERIGGHGFRIGIHWQGSALSSRDGRAIPLAAFAPLAAVPGVRLISLQVGDGAGQASALSQPFPVETPGEDFDRGPDAFLDTAAVMQSLDLVVSCDSAVAHLAGALGRPAWLALKAVPDWRWLLNRPDTPWYPSMRLFRQQSPGDWCGVFEAMAAELRAGTAPGAGGSP